MKEDLIKTAAEKYITPMYLYNKEDILNNAKKLKQSFPDEAALYFSMKANPLLGICQIMQEICDGVEVASAGELYTALKAGVEPEHILFSSPGKTEEELAYAIDAGIHMINIESVEEALLIESLSEERNRVTSISVRINPVSSYSNAKIKMSGVSSQFGIEEEDLLEVFQNLQCLKHISLDGLQVYMGTQNLLAEYILNNTEYILQLAGRISKEMGITFHSINFGGGFGVPYFKNESELDMDALKKGIQELFKVYANELGGARPIFESGRYLLANAGVYITKVLYKKISKGMEYLICDGGSNFHSASAFLGRFVRNNYPMHILGKENEESIYTVTGPLCTPTDVIGQKVCLNHEAEAGDFIIIEKSGAYGLTFSPADFLSHEKPIEVLADENGFFVLRERKEKESILIGQNTYV